ncbi:exo-alpha-sialidase [Ramlibacter tataouinensis]|uniref:sialidase family protein n=1 Tax=Ramlibacter tataouinensis TaxID=94132 RepID=UPI0022F40150|nr:exo-alpha-sialidase [Ramlibacter tataouinensis]WBY01790.1 exo-alpha-sialidase [Ramlibacter tataouinensis]
MTAAVAALWLSACGGGGGDDVAAAPNPPLGGAPAPAPAPAPAAAVGVNWTAPGPVDVWHSLSSSDDGQVMVAGQAQAADIPASLLSLSTDGGQTWTNPAGLPGAIWIASDVSGTGDRIVAVNLAGGMFISNDRGATFAAVPLPAGVVAPAFEGVTLSQDGTRVAAVSMDGPVLAGTIDAAGAVTWLTPTGLPAVATGWRSIDSSNNGQVMVAVGQDPAAFISTNGGATWAALPVAVGTPPAAVVNQNWYRVKVSGDGNTIVMAANAFGGNSGDGIYVSKDQGATFTLAHTLTADYTGIAMSADGGVIAVTHSSNTAADAGAGQILLSSNGGTTFAPLAVSVGGTAEPDAYWRTVTMSADATRLAAAKGRFDTNVSGPIFLSTGSRP